MPRLRGPPRGHPPLPGMKAMTVLPLIFDTIPELGATKLRATFPYPFLNLTGRFQTLAVVVTFSRFLAGKFHRMPKIGCVFTIATPYPDKTKQKIQKGGIQIKYEERARDDISSGRRNFGRETTFHPVRDVIRVGSARRSRSGQHELPVKSFR